MKQIYFKSFLLCLSVLGISSMSSAQSFTAVFHEYDDFSYIDEIVHGDFNGDGSLDFVIVATSNSEVSVGIGNGVSRPAFTEIEDDLTVVGVTTIDLDLDGDLDFVGSAPFESESYVWRNDGAANFTREALSIVDYDAIHFTDIDSDGMTEAIVSLDSKINIYDISQGEFVLAMTIFDDVFAGSAGGITSLDFNMDGTLDIVAVFARDGIVLFPQDLGFGEQTLFRETFNDDALHVTELNGDGIYDFVVQSDFEQRSSVILSNAAGEYEEIAIPRASGDNLYTDVADFNNDGVPEILHADGDIPVDVELALLNLDGDTGEFMKSVITEDHASTDDGGIVDLDGDGDLDIYLYTNDFFDTGIAFYLQGGLVDSDGDGFTSDVDCDDNNSDVNPGEVEEPYNGIDDDCDSTTLDDDLDGDGFLFDDDCDDSNADINPDASEIPNNGIDEDCDGLDEVSATHELADATISIYPNPVGDNLYVDIEGQIDVILSLYTMEGKLMMQSKNMILNLAATPPGNYLLEVRDVDSGQRIVEKIVIDR